jgi:arylsulfatase A-like enzyme
VAVFTAMIVWLPLRVVEWFSLRRRWKISIEHLLMFIGVFVLFGAIVWKGKRLMWPVQTTLQLKLTVFLCVVLGAMFLTWLFRNKAERWIGIIQERITPLVRLLGIIQGQITLWVWLFGIWFILSVPLVAYHTWIKQTDNVVSQKINQAFIADKSRPNIILVTFDTLTARDMSVYGYHRPTTPFITEWAKSASLFTRLQAESNHTTPTTASLMTGKRLWSHQTYHGQGSKPVRSDIENLPLLLKNNGYYNMAFIVSSYATVKTLGISNSFAIAPIATELVTPDSLFGWQFGIIDTLLYQLFGDKIRLHNWIEQWDFIFYRVLNRVLIGVNVIPGNFSKTTVPPEKAFNRFLAVIDDNLPEPFFAWIHLFPPHGPYLPPEPYRGMFKSSIEKSISQNRVLYDEFIRYCDKQFEDFIAQLAERNKLKNTVVILSSDHGKSFERRKHGYFGHRDTHLYEQLTHIPLIIKEPNQTKGQIINDLIEQIDIPATILEIANIPVPSWMEGRSLVPLMRGKRLPSRSAFSMNFKKNHSRGHQITKGTIAVWKGDYKLIHYLEEKKSLLFNLKEDPDELKNLFNKEPEVGQRLLTLIQDNLKKANERISRGE